MLVSMPFMLTDLPAPVDPAISRWGIVARSAMYGSPWIVLPSAIVSLDVDRRYASDSSSSRSEIGSRVALGIWIPTVDLPAMRSISTESAFIARQRSSARPVIFAYFTPASGLNSNVVTTGPGWIWTTVPSTENSRHFSSSSRALSISSRSSILRSVLIASSSDTGGRAYSPLRRSAGAFVVGSGSGSGSEGATSLGGFGGANDFGPADTAAGAGATGAGASSFSFEREKARARALLAL